MSIMTRKYRGVIRQAYVNLLTLGSQDENRGKGFLFLLFLMRVAFTYEQSGTRFLVHKSGMERA